MCRRKLPFLGVFVFFLLGLPLTGFAQRRQLLDVLEPGQHVTMTKSSGSYDIRIYTKAQREAAQQEYKIQAFAYTKERSISSVSRARSRELMERLRAARAEERAALTEEFRRASFASSFARSRGRSSSRPRSQVFYEISEIGRDFVAVRRDEEITYVAVSSIDTITQTVQADAAAAGKLRFAQLQLDILSRMLQVYYLDIGAFPTAAQGLGALVRPPMDLKDPSKWRGPYYYQKQTPRDPWGQLLQYSVEKPKKEDKQSQVSYVIRSHGPDGKPNTKDDLQTKQSAPPIPASARPAARDPFGGGGFGRGGADPFGR